MPALKYKVNLTEDEKLSLEATISKGKGLARSIARAHILLKAAAGVQDGDIMEALNVSATMVFNTRQRCVEEGPEAALKDRPRPGKAPKLGEKQAAHIIALACSDAPEGHDHWTLRLLANKVVELSYASSCSHETIRQLLKKKHSKTLAEARVVHSRCKRRFCSSHGRCA